MQSSITTRLIFLLVMTVLVSFCALTWVFHKSTSDAFISQRNEELSLGGPGRIERQLASEFGTAWRLDGWSAVQSRLEEMSEQDENLERFNVFVIDVSNCVVVSNEQCMFDAAVEKVGENEFVLESAPGSRHGFEIRVDGGPILRRDDGHILAYLFAIPRQLEQQEGDEFASIVRQSAVLSLLSILALAVGITVWVLRVSLRPLNDLTGAAKVIQSGRIPSEVDRQGVAEFQSLIDAFNSATRTMARTDEIRRRMVSDIAHELRTPLTNMRSVLEAAESELIEDPAEVVRTLKIETNLLERLVEDFQQLTLFDTGQLRMSLFPVPLAEAIESYRLSMCEKDECRLTINVPEDLFVLADADRLKQVFCNLLENSIRHGNNRPAIDISAHAAGDNVVIQFCDDGPGIDSADSPYVFDRLYRADKSRTRATGGAGLGLAISKALLEAMGGAIRLCDESRHTGACFEIELPIARDGISI